tara:strand:+ start:726 stop:920 length:195 start_codon:yes stop_codon:yes gene_type:complete
MAIPPMERNLSMEDQQPITTNKILDVTSGKVLDVPNKNKKILDFEGNSESWLNLIGLLIPIDQR